MGSREQEPGRPGGRAEDRRRQFEDSRGLTEHRELSLDDDSAEDPAAESAADSADDENGDSVDDTADDADASDSDADAEDQE
ncbi:hypothetical protein [Kribbella sp. NPDC004875]|uniref:hypothetical protein n=1 Tax=Kribbella sp. NPDC004875 TaxID=3364107 RepID=UPI0036BFD281